MPDGAALSKLNLLCVDDDPQVLKLRRAVLETNGYHVLLAENGHAGLVLFTSHDIACVIMDFNMPGMDGGEVARKMKSLNPSVPVLIVTGAALSDSDTLGADSVIPKAAPGAELLERLSHLLGTHPSSSQSRQD